MAVVDTLDYLPKDHPEYAAVVEIINQLMEAVVAFQDKESGVWYQVMDKPDGEGNYLESSCSAMLVYSILKGVRNGYLPERFLEAGEKGYQGIQKQFLDVSADGQIHILKGCAVAGLGGEPYRDGSYDYYVGETVRSDDPKAIGAFILAGLEYEKVLAAEPVLAN